MHAFSPLVWVEPCILDCVQVFKLQLNEGQQFLTVSALHNPKRLPVCSALATPANYDFSVWSHHALSKSILGKVKASYPATIGPDTTELAVAGFTIMNAARGVLRAHLGF